jgi:hypothetical protein
MGGSAGRDEIHSTAVEAIGNSRTRPSGDRGRGTVATVPTIPARIRAIGPDFLRTIGEMGVCKPGRELLVARARQEQAGRVAGLNHGDSPQAFSVLGR